MKAHNGGHTAPAAITFDGEGATTAADMSKLRRLKWQVWSWRFWLWKNILLRPSTWIEAVIDEVEIHSKLIQNLFPYTVHNKMCCRAINVVDAISIQRRASYDRFHFFRLILLMIHPISSTGRVQTAREGFSMRAEQHDWKITGIRRFGGRGIRRRISACW